MLKKRELTKDIRKGLHCNKITQTPNMKYVTIGKRNGIAENHKIFLNEFPKSGLQTETTDNRGIHACPFRHKTYSIIKTSIKPLRLTCRNSTFNGYPSVTKL